MKTFCLWAFGLFVFYTIYLLGAEFWNHPDVVNTLCNQKSASWVGFNSTLITTLFWGTALLFAVCYVASENKKNLAELNFYKFEMYVFLLLGITHQFIGLATIPNLLHIPTMLIAIIFVGIQFLLFLIMLSVIFNPAPSGILKFLIYSVIFFIFFGLLDLGREKIGVPLFRSIVIPGLLKTWIAACYFIVAWRILLHKLNGTTGVFPIIQDSITNRIVMHRTQNEQQGKTL